MWHISYHILRVHARQPRGMWPQPSLRANVPNSNHNPARWLRGTRPSRRHTPNAIYELVSAKGKYGNAIPDAPG